MTPSRTIAALLRLALIPADWCAPMRGPSHGQVARRLADWHRQGRRAIRILDLDCGNGERLLRAAERARELGFVAIEGRGVDPYPAHVRRARRRARALAHAGTSLTFQVMEPIAALAGEYDRGADLILLSEPLPYPVSPMRAALDRVCAGTILASC